MPIILRLFKKCLLFSRYESLKPEGFESHGYGVIGTAMIFIGVITYSTRKRMKRLANFGRISDFLDFHIFMCLVGPIMVMYHTTFKFGGIAGAGSWCMTAVVLSGFIGRYFYRFIPKNIQGHELSAREVDEEQQRLFQELKVGYDIKDNVIDQIDMVADTRLANKTAGFFKLLWYLLSMDFSKWNYKKRIREILRQHAIPSDTIRKISAVAQRRIVLRQRIIVLEKIRLVFHSGMLFIFPSR